MGNGSACPLVPTVSGHLDDRPWTLVRLWLPNPEYPPQPSDIATSDVNKLLSSCFKPQWGKDSHYTGR